MRWDNLRLDDQVAADQDTTAGETLFPAERRDVALPLIERGAVARTFDTPGFRGMTFYEVQAKSVVNRVPRRYWKEDIIEPEVMVSSTGEITVPQSVGRGFDVREDLIDQLTVRKEEIRAMAFA